MMSMLSVLLRKSVQYSRVLLWSLHFKKNNKTKHRLLKAFNYTHKGYLYLSLFHVYIYNCTDLPFHA